MSHNSLKIPVKKISEQAARRIGSDPANDKNVMVDRGQGYVECNPKEATNTVYVQIGEGYQHN